MMASASATMITKQEAVKKKKQAVKFFEAKIGHLTMLMKDMAKHHKGDHKGEHEEEQPGCKKDADCQTDGDVAAHCKADRTCQCSEDYVGTTTCTKGSKDMVGWKMRQYSKEQQDRLHVD